MKKNLPVSNKEKTFPSHYNILSTTDLKGAVTYANPEFSEVAGFSLEELLGKNHNVVRHPDMPPAAYQDLWDTLDTGNSWMGIVKNRCKNGDHYWVDAYITPIRKDGKVVEHQSVRFQPSRERVDRAEQTYKMINAGALPKAVTRTSTTIRQRLLFSAALSFIPMIFAAVMSANPIVIGSLCASAVILTILMIWQTYTSFLIFYNCFVCIDSLVRHL